MNWQDAVVEAWRYQERLGVKPSARKAIEMARMVGAKFRNGDAFTLLEKFRGVPREQSGSSRGAENEHVGSTREAPGEQSGRAFVRANKVFLVPKYSDSNESVSVAPAPPTPAVEKKRRTKAEQTDVPFEQPSGTLEPYVRPAPDDLSQPLWVRQMRAWAETVFDRPLKTLAPGELLKLGRYHAWRWANCTRDAPRNIAAAGKIVVGLKTLADDRRYGAITVNDYVVAGDDLWDRTGRRPSFRVWSVISQLEQVA